MGSSETAARFLVLFAALTAVCRRPCLTAVSAAALDAASQQLTISQQQHILALQHPPQQSAPAPALALPELYNYTFEAAKDTFELCHETSGLTRDIPLEELLPIFKLPDDLTRRKSINLEELINLLHDVQPDFRVVWQPMLFGEPDIGSLLSPDGLPRLVHFTVKDKNDLLPHQVVSMASWAYYNPGHSLMLFDDGDIHNFMTSYYPELLPTFDGLSSQVERTDMWRYLVLCKMGGVYADSDVVCARPVSTWVQDAGLLVGIENVFTTPEEAKRRDYTRQIQMVQWAIASRKGHPVVCRMGDYVAAHVVEEQQGQFVDPDRNHAILERTGPGIWSSSVHDYISQAGGLTMEQLVAGGRVGDVRVLPQPVFGCASATFNPEQDPYPYVYHMFKGSWRAKHESKVLSFVTALYKTLHVKKQQENSQQAVMTEAAAAAAEAAEFARSQQAQPAADKGTVLPPALPAAETLAEAFKASAAMKSHPKLPILDEQILEHKKQLLLKQQAELQRQQQQAGFSKPRRQEIRLAPADPSSSMSAGTATLVRQQQPAAAPTGVGAPGVQVQQQLPQMAVVAAAAAVKAAASLPAGDTRKLRSQQALLVRGMPTANVAAAGMPGVPLAEPELPSSALSSMPTLCVLVLVVVICAVYKQQQGSSLLSGLYGWAGRAAGSSKSFCSSIKGGGLSSRPGSRVMLAGAGGSALSLPAVAAATRPPLPERSASLLQEQVAEVCYASNQQHHPHRHKRSWGSSSNFQQL